MSLRGLTYYEEHFLFSYRVVQFIMGLRPCQNSYDQFLFVCVITLYSLPMILYQLYQLFISEINFKLAVNVLQKTFTAISFICTYSTTYFSYVTMRSIFAHFKDDYKLTFHEDELYVINKYTKQSKFYTLIVLVIYNLYAISLVSPCILNILLYLFCALDDIDLILPFTVNNNIKKAGLLYYILLIYEIIALYILMIVAAICFSLYLVVIQHACSQFSLIMLKIRQPFTNRKCVKKICFGGIHNYDELGWIIDVTIRYRRVIKFVNMLNNFSKILYLILIFLAVFLIVFDFLYMFQISTKLKNNSEIIERSFYIAASIFTIYVNFYCGQKLINHSNATFEELCQVPFYTLSIRTQKLLLFALTKSIKPCELSIGGFFVSSHEVFAGILQKAFSFSLMYYNVQ